MKNLILLIVLICLQEKAKSQMKTMPKANQMPAKTTTSAPRPTTTTDIIYDYSLLSNLTIISPGNLSAPSNKPLKSNTTTPFVINPRAQLNETITNIKEYIPEIQAEVS